MARCSGKSEIKTAHKGKGRQAKKNHVRVAKNKFTIEPAEYVINLHYRRWDRITIKRKKNILQSKLFQYAEREWNGRNTVGSICIRENKKEISEGSGKEY